MHAQNLGIQLEKCRFDSLSFRLLHSKMFLGNINLEYFDYILYHLQLIQLTLTQGRLKQTSRVYKILHISESVALRK